MKLTVIHSNPIVAPGVRTHLPMSLQVPFEYTEPIEVSVTRSRSLLASLSYT